MTGVELESTTAAEVGAALARERRRSGSGQLGMVLTLVVHTDERGHYDAVRAATHASMSHPCRILTVIRRAPRDRVRLDAEVSVGGAANPGETVILRMFGELGEHAESVVVPLLLPDAPVVVWWPSAAPASPAASPLGALGKRRVTDAAAATRPVAELQRRARGYTPGDTDLAWTRLTPWRTLLAAALDQPHDEITSAVVRAASGNPSAALLATWLRLRLDVSVDAKTSRGPGITEVTLRTARGDIEVNRPDGVRAILSRPGQHEHNVALPRRDTTDLVAEELQRLDPDEPYGETLAAFAAEHTS
ncbi:MAG: glucose-6-phosphate dehydrogenase assembly protein OpcA [Mycobacteriales bacterium]